MAGLARPLATLCALAAAALTLAGNLIHEEAMSTYRRAVEECGKNKPKATALLRGLLLNTVVIGIDKSTMPGDDYDWQDGVLAGLGVWSNSMDDSPFVMAQEGEKPDILIRFVDKIENGNDVQGLVKAQRHFYWQGSQSGARVSGTILVRNNVGRRWISGDEISRVVGHELGHLLGLDDDRQGNGIMGDFVAGRGHKQPSQLEIDSVLDFRKMVRQALKDQASPSGSAGSQK
jgi:hypothetical protein